ncbi:DUF222 domain-containing protein [Glutamicibacter sp. 287]|uniref:HNH endonuclease signature motif containing protein n=1 Tax=unclassified Glutamicibacter TaxID=2627139 RepID=UPI000BB8192B|nr:HNH endonuclease signature motif containing protein [Glutamicibacter sp. BW80]PCC28312.1 hypothetical protein CIK76_12200 [Glutamicibacter sp. BW80]
MGLQDIFQSDDDTHRLPLSPPGHRDASHPDGLFSSLVEHEKYFGQIAALATELYNLPPLQDPGSGLVRLQKLARLRRMLDAAEAVTLSDSVELVAQVVAENSCADPKTETEQQRRERISANYYGVDPASEQIIRSNFVAEAAVALRESEEKVRGKLFIADGLRHLCTGTLDALAAGEITTKAAGDIVKQAQDLGAADIRRMEHVLLPMAKTASDAAVSQRARRMHDRLNPVSAQERHEAAKESRALTHWSEADGMAALKLRAPAADIISMVNTVKYFARHDVDPGDSRTQGQREADIFRDALLDGWPATGGTPLKTRVALTIPAVETLADPKRALADLEGYGPIPVGTALALAKDAPSMLRVLTDPWTGAAIDVGRQKYRPSQALKDLLRVREVHCCFPGCRRTAETSEIDHVEDWAKGGHTDRSNTKLLCKRHQMLKHALGWQSIYRPDGSVSWRTPHGLVCLELPGSVEVVQNFDHVHDRTPVREVGLNDRVRRVLGWADPPDRIAS